MIRVRVIFFFFQAEDGIRDFCLSRGLGDVYKRQQYFRKLIEEPWGFETKDRLAFNVTVPDRFFPSAAAKQTALEASLVQLQGVPGVKSATVVSPSPMDAPWTLMLFNAERAPAPEPRGVYTAY